MTYHLYCHGGYLARALAITESAPAMGESDLDVLHPPDTRLFPGSDLVADIRDGGPGTRATIWGRTHTRSRD